MTEIKYKICETTCDFLCRKPGKLFHENIYDLYHCPNCDFYFVSNPNRDFDKLYDEKYYSGRGADSLIDYVYEIENPDKTIRVLEYEGILEIIQNVMDKNEIIEWLDLGCGTGGLIEWVKHHSNFSIKGYDSGYGATLAKERGIDIISENEFLNSNERFTVITAIETLEHVENPKQFLQTVEKLLKPGGIFFFTTGNSEPFSKKICKWNYFIPEIHISLFCEKSIKTLFEIVGLGYITLSEKEKSGWVTIYKFKILKNLKIKKNSSVYKLIPWRIVFFFFDTRYKLSWGIGRKR